MVCILSKITRFLPANTHKLLKSYLTDRTFKIKLKDELSTTKKISASVLQGSILGSIPDIIYTLDIPTNPNIYKRRQGSEGSINTFAVAHIRFRKIF